MKKKDKTWTDAVLEALYECWKSCDNERELAKILEEKFPKIHPIASLSMVRKMIKTEKKWAQMATRKKNEKEKIKNEKNKEKEEKIKKAKERKEQKEVKKQQKEKRNKEKNLREKIKQKLDLSKMDDFNKHIDTEFFFCSEMQQYMPVVSCIYRVFGNEPFYHGACCEKCKHMEKYFQLVKEITKC